MAIMNDGGYGRPPNSSSSTLKRKRSLGEDISVCLSPSKVIRCLSEAELALALPGALLHPPNHPSHLPAMQLAMSTILKLCAHASSLSAELECRTWVVLAELCMNLIGAGLTDEGGPSWTRNLETQMERAVGKAMSSSQRNPSLRLYRHRITLLHAEFVQWQANYKFSRLLLRGSFDCITVNDSPHVLYAGKLAMINQALTSHPSDLKTAFSGISDLGDLARCTDPAVALIANSIRLQALFRNGMWNELSSALAEMEASLGLTYESSNSRPSQSQSSLSINSESSLKPEQSPSKKYVAFMKPVEVYAAIHTLMVGIIYHTHVGCSAEASQRLKHFHSIMDDDCQVMFPEGIIRIPLASGLPLIVHITHPRVLYFLTFLMTGVSKRDVSGRKPKRRSFLELGIEKLDQERFDDIAYPLWASGRVLQEIEDRLVKIHADLLCDVVSVFIMRGEVEKAYAHLYKLTAFTRTQRIFDFYSSMISLYHGYLAHLQGDLFKALDCYSAASFVVEQAGVKGSNADSDPIWVAARAGEIAIRIHLQGVEEDIKSDCVRVIAACKGLDNHLHTIGTILEAIICEEIVRSKIYLKTAMDAASLASNSYLRLLTLALSTSHYIHTAEDHARLMLETCVQMASGHGAKSKHPASLSNDPETLNPRFSLWLGERLEGLYKRTDAEDKATKQVAENQRLRHLVSTACKYF